ncbi:MAG: hypothetical protein L0206_11185, partial [Actinobacteria bacterium]|nr:hypothetical protein [Actinomycetota bacterium]
MPTRISLLALAALLFATASAAAELRIKSIRFVDRPAPQKPDQVAPRVVLQAVIAGAVPGLREKDITANVAEGSLPVSIQATKSVPFHASDDELALFVLVQGNVRFMGNAEAGIDGYYEEIKQVIDTIAAARPRATRIGLHVYGSNVLEKAPMGPAANVSGELLGPASE